MNKSFVLFLVLLFFIQACGSKSPAPSPIPTKPSVVSETKIPLEASRLEQLGGHPCPDSDFTCIKITVPLDHFDPQGSRTMEVVFAVQPATGERKGMFVNVVGGPGGSGVLSADSYTSYFDPNITRHFDIIFFDQRGVNLSGGLQCAQSAADFYSRDMDGTTSSGEKKMFDSAQAFVNDCVKEMGNSDLLPYLDTVQAVEDLEAFRQAMGDEKFWLYGESYGTQFAQTYAASYPDHLAGLILDGTVDLTLTDTEFLKGQAAAFNDVLIATLNACNEDASCSEAMGRDALSIYDDLAAQLKQSSIPFDYTLAAGRIQRREFTFPDLENTSGFLYSETARMMFLRALAYYAHDKALVPLARVAYNSLYLNPDTLQAVPDASYSDAVYYGVTCRDYAEPGSTPEERALNFIQAGDETDSSLPRFASIFYSDLPCAFWPYPLKDETRPAPLKADGIPTLVLNATTDPATPYSGARDVYSRLADGYFVTEIGGPHVIFGWGNTCVDDLVARFLVDDKLPAGRETTCEGVVADEFVPLAPKDAADFANPLEALASADNEINYQPEYFYMYDNSIRIIACPFGGTFGFDSTDTSDVYKLTNCAFSQGFVMSGDGSYNYEDGMFKLEVIVTGLKEGSLTYSRDGDGNRHVTGTYAGQTVDLTNP